MGNDPARELCLRLAQSTLLRIHTDRKRASVQVAKLLALIAKHLLDPDLQVDGLLRQAGVQNKNISTQFAAELGLPPGAYIKEARMELAGRMLAESRLAIWRIGAQVGYLTAGSFGRAFKDWSGKTPSRFRRAAKKPQAEKPPVDLDQRDIERALVGELPRERAEQLAGRLLDLEVKIRHNYHRLDASAAAAETVELAMARNLWKWIEPLPWEVQESAVVSQAPAYRTAALFHHLCLQSFQAPDDISALQRCTLALECLETVVKRPGAAAKNAYARGWSIASLAQVRAGELADAKQNQRIAIRCFELIGDDVDPWIFLEFIYAQLACTTACNDSEATRLIVEAGRPLLERLRELSSAASDDALEGATAQP